MNFIHTYLLQSYMLFLFLYLYPFKVKNICNSTNFHDYIEKIRLIYYICIHNKSATISSVFPFHISNIHHIMLQGTVTNPRSTSGTPLRTPAPNLNPARTANGPALASAKEAPALAPVYFQDAPVWAPAANTEA